ncbi:hypothetical protein E4T81_11230 [Barnesiella sp. WM24]|uniref:Ig-like domain-containing protein n=1 Tax=Barnesiella sp. WM24 TaxID=2558278 RepID=UPI001071BF6D|nr:Ig-like domain-containing protein [Barnesiella sp. WM24]TFU92458.1 hypothetical protein E4T81_11230 [Barnesiella sp. WM24]
MANGGAIGNFSYRAVKPGNTSISFSTTNGTTKTFDVIVVEAKVKSIELSTDLDCVFPGETVHLSAKVSPENAIQTVKYEVNNGSQLGWTDLCDDKIEVSPEWDGNVSTIRIRAKSTDGFDVTSGICDVRICNVNKMHFYTDSLTVGVGDTKSNSLYFGNISPYTVLHYKSEDENIAIAGDEAKITGVSPGRTTISVYRKGCNIPIANFPVEVYVPVKSIELDRYEIHVPFYTYFTINAKVLPENATDKRISFYKTSAINGHDNKWYISPPFNNGAEIEAHSVENPDIKAVCKVYQETFQYGLSNLDSDKIYLSRGESVTVEPFIRPEYQNDRTWEYSSSDSDIAEINQNGCITAKNIGTTTICVSTDTDGWRAVIYKDVIVINKVSSISLNPSSAEEKEGEQIQIKATVLPEDATNKVLAWSSSDESVASVDNNGLVSLLKEGHALITAYSTDGSDIVATCNISVIKRDVLVSSISLDSSYAEGKEGEQIQIKATVLPEDATNKVLAWSSSDESVASVDDNGLVSLLKEGHALITAYATDGSDIIATCNISVIKRDVLVAYISFDPSYAEGKEGEQIQIKATVLPEDATNKVLAWSSSDESVASVDNNGLVSLLKEGHALITAYATDGSDIVATCNISVMKRDVLVSSISLDPSYAEGKEGEQIQIKATVLPEDATNKTIEWSSSDESTATVDDFGLISLLKKGTAVIMASTTDGSGISAECAVVVSELLGIEEILTNESSYVKIFNLSGILVYEGIYSDANLVPDYYIVVCDGKNVKAKILHKNATSMTNRQ